MGNRASQTSQMPARVLIVEDDGLLRTGLRLALEKWGYHVGEAGSGEEAQEALREQDFDLLILDLHLPGMSGKELMHQACRLCPGLRVIVLTGQPDLDSAILAVRYRAVDYLVKPIDLNDLAGALRRGLDGKGGEIQPAEPSVVSLGDMTLDPEAGRLIVSQADGTGAEVAL
ncbi:MAG: response regulator, partial [Anaerolineae bacterium]